MHVALADKLIHEIMPQPYGLVCQIKRTAGRHVVSFTYDEAVFTKEQALEGVRGVWRMVERLVKSLEQGVETSIHALIEA